MVKKLAIGFLAVLFVFAGCDDDSDCVNCPTGTSPTLENIWPNADSTFWGYDHTMTEWDAELTLYPTLDAVPDDPIPNWYEVFEYLENDVPPAPVSTEGGVMTLTFDGMTTTGPGVTAQNLEQEIVIGSRSGRPATRGDRLLHRRQLSDTGAGLLERSAAVNEGPRFLHGGAWEKSSSGIVSYGELDQNPAWRYLSANLYIGSTFSLQLLPALAPNVILHGTVYRQVSVPTSGGTIRKALDCLYLVDYGIAAVTNIEGQFVGYVRAIDLGRVIYAPTIGPVYSYERLGVEPGDTLSAGIADFTEELVETNALDE